MSDERFPPPRGHEGYREAAAPAPEPSAPPSHHPRVVATLASDPEHPPVESVHPERAPEEKPPATPRVLVAFVMVLVILLSVVVIVRLMRPAIPPPKATPARQLPR